jgi:hypothetical protein
MAPAVVVQAAIRNDDVSAAEDLAGITVGIDNAEEAVQKQAFIVGGTRRVREEQALDDAAVRRQLVHQVDESFTSGTVRTHAHDRS